MKKLSPFLIMFIIVVLMFAVVIETIPIQAETTILVNITSDVIDSGDGFCSLREAIIAANNDTPSGSENGECAAGSGADIITFSAGLPAQATFVLSTTGPLEDLALTGDLDISSDLTINGAGAGATIIDGNGTDRIIDIQPSTTVSISGVTIRNGNPGPNQNGGAVAVQLTGRLTIDDSAIIHNTAANGGGAHVLGLLNLIDSTVEANSGGGIVNDAGLLIISNTHILINTQGFGIRNVSQGILQITGGSVSFNSGGGIENYNATVTLSELIISDNTIGGGGHNWSQGSATELTINNSMIISNTGLSGAGLLNEGTQATTSVEQTQISFNATTLGGGGGINNSGALSLVESTVDHNSARSGGGIDHSGFSLSLTNVTISQNDVSDNGGGLYNRSSASLTNVTIANNRASGPFNGRRRFPLT